MRRPRTKRAPTSDTPGAPTAFASDPVVNDPATHTKAAPRPEDAANDVPGRNHDALEARIARVRERAYWRAEARGFAPGHELDDWLQAEAEEPGDDSIRGSR